MKLIDSITKNVNEVKNDISFNLYMLFNLSSYLIYLHL